MGKWVVRATGSRARGPAAPRVPGDAMPWPGRDAEAADLWGSHVGELQPPEPGPGENPPPRLSARGADTRQHRRDPPCRLHRPLFPLCLPHPGPPCPPLQPSWLCPARAWVPCGASAPTFPPPSERCKQQRLLLGERHRCSDRRPNPAAHPGPRQAARAEHAAPQPARRG